MLTREDPPEMAVEKTVAPWRMHIELGVGVQMVMAVFSRPPQHALLGRALGQHGKRELECTASRVGAMRKISMVSSTDRKNAQPVEHRAYPDRPPSDPGPKARDARQVH